MAGNKNSGSVRKPTAVLKLEGAYREDRHGKRKAEPLPAGCPEMPSGLSAVARRHWRLNVPMIVEMGVAKAIDATSLAAMCESWAVWWELQQEYHGCELPERLKMVNRLIAARRDYGQQAGMFGMTPADRARLTVDKVEDVDEMDALMA